MIDDPFAQVTFVLAITMSIVMLVLTLWWYERVVKHRWPSKRELRYGAILLGVWEVAVGLFIFAAGSTAGGGFMPILLGVGIIIGAAYGLFTGEFGQRR